MSMILTESSRLILFRKISTPCWNAYCYTDEEKLYWWLDFALTMTIFSILCSYSDSHVYHLTFKWYIMPRVSLLNYYYTYDNIYVTENKYILHDLLWFYNKAAHPDIGDQFKPHLSSLNIYVSKFHLVH